MKISNITIYALIGLGLLMIIISALSPGLVGVSPVENFAAAATRIPRCMGGMIEVQGENGGVRCCDTADCRNTTRSCVLTGSGANCDSQYSEILSRANCPRGQEGVLDEDGSMKCQSKTTNQQCHSSGPNEGGSVPCADISAADCPSGYVPARREVAGFQNVLVCERAGESSADQCVATTQDIERIRAERPEVILPGPQVGREGRNCLVLREQPPPSAGMMPMQNEFEIVDEKLATPMKLRYHQNKRSGDFCIFRSDRDKLDRLLSSRVICKAYQDMYMRKLCPEVDA